MLLVRRVGGTRTVEPLPLYLCSAQGGRIFLLRTAASMRILNIVLAIPIEINWVKSYHYISSYKVTYFPEI